MAKETKKPGTALVKWDDKFAQYAKETTAGFAASSAKFLSLRNGQMSLGGAKVVGNKLQCIFIGAVYENVFYNPNEPFDPENIQSPLCYAFGTEQSTMAPHEQAPEKQSSICQNCAQNVFGSAKNGKGKACSNRVRAAFITMDQLEDAETIDTIEPIYVRVPVTSVNNWKRYISVDLKALGRPYWSMVTEMALTPDAKTQFQLLFSTIEKIEDTDYFGPLEALWRKVTGGIEFPYAPLDNTGPVKKKVPLAKAAPRNLRRNKFAAT